MTTAYTSLLGLALPVTGELSGTWGDTVNNYITQYLDAAVEGTQTISGSQTTVTLSVTTNASLSQVGAGATGSAQYAVINCTGNPASLLTVTVPASSRQYIVINATSTSQSVQIVGVGPTTGVTIASGEKAVVAWNGSDFVKVASSIVATGDVVGPASATANAIVLFDGTTGKLIKDSATTLPTGSLVGTTDTQTLTNKTIAFSANTLTDVASTSTAQTFTNKRIDPRVTSAASASSLTPDVSAADIYAYTALAAGLTINAPIGTPVDGDKLIFRILDNGVARTLTWNATYTVIGVTLPTTTTANKTTYVGCIYNSNNTRWDVIAVTTQA